MLRKEIQAALEAAAAISNHSEFVVAGSLSVLGLLAAPPELMAVSIDIDFYPLRDPQYAYAFVKVLGENSEFHQLNGYYLDPISPDLPALPMGWQDRLVKLQLGGITAYFLEIHDTAISKYARCADNDLVWLESGYENGLLDWDTVAARARFGLDELDFQDVQNIRRGVEKHRHYTKFIDTDE